MKRAEVIKLKAGDKIIHKHFGKCLVTGYVHDFGPKLIPCYYRMRVALNNQTGMHFNTPILETSFRLILQKYQQ